MKTLALFLLCLASCLGQTATTTLYLVGPASARPGTVVNWSVCTKGGSPAGVQWTLGYPAGYTGTAVVGTSAIEAGKILACGSLNEVCLVYGINANLLPDGEVARYTITIPATATPGPTPVPLTGLVAASLLGEEIPTVEGTPYSILILKKTDLDGSGRTDDADVGLMVRQILRMAPCTGDQNGDGRCNLLDLILVIRGQD